MHALPPLRLLSVVGTRPEAIKIAPIALAAAGDPRFRHRILATGQHDVLFDEALADFGLMPDLRLDFRATGDLDVDGAMMRGAVGALLTRERPDMVIVQGDTSSAYAAAWAAKDVGLPLAHVEAGLRSGHPVLPFPEEGFRTSIDRIADLLLAPGVEGVANLRADPEVRGEIRLTGNTAIDALRLMGALDRRDLHQDAGELLVTVHRRENIEALPTICGALRALAGRGNLRITLPVHRNPRVAHIIQKELAGTPAVRLVPHLHYPAMIAAMQGATLILSDSGGVQEEAAALGVPLLVMREQTERPEVVQSGNARLIGTDTEVIVSEVTRLLENPVALAAMAVPNFPYGRGDAAPRILDAVAHHLGRALPVTSEAAVAFAPFPAQQVLRLKM